MIRLFRVSFPVSAITLLISEMLILFASYTLAAYIDFGSESEQFLFDNNGLSRIAVVVFAFGFGMYLADLYANLRVRSRAWLIQTVIGVLGSSLIVEGLVGYSVRDWALPKRIVIIGSLVTVIAVSIWRILFSRFAIESLSYQTVLFVGSSALASDIGTRLRHCPEFGIKVLGYVADEPLTDTSIKWLGRLADVYDVVAGCKPDRVVLAMAERRARLPIDALMKVRLSGVFVEDIAHLYEFVFGRVCVNEIRPSYLILSTSIGPRPWIVRVQSVYSSLIAAVALLFSAPILLITAILVKLTSPGPVLYRQRRVGLNGRTFFVYKFRSMYHDAETRTGAVWASRNDPRITPLGRFIRKTRIDELPQLLNVLRGEMTIVGPRPERPEFVRQLNVSVPFYDQRHCVKPGITGWAQVNYRYGDTVDDSRVKLEYDLYYIRNLSPSLDMYIMFQTMKTMLLSRGAQ